MLHRIWIHSTRWLAALLLVGGSLGIAASPAAGQAARRAAESRRYPPNMPDAQAEVYKKVGGVELNVYKFLPAGHQASEKRPAVVFFFGGGWQGGSPGQFEQQCRYLASRGVVALSADYRVASRQQVKAVECVRDALDCIRWVKANAARLGIDPERIVASGGSAGGHLAACTGTIDRLTDEPADAASARPAAMVLFNPAVALAPIPGMEVDERRLSQVRERMGVEPESLSPYHHVSAKTPPSLILIGAADSLYPSCQKFAEKVQEAGGRCEVAAYPDMPHGFFNYGRNENKEFLATLAAMDRFLGSLGYVEGEPTVETFFAAP